MPRPAAGGKLLALCGGFHKAAEVDTREMAVLNLDTLAWDKPGTGRLAAPLKEHCALAVGRTKVSRPGQHYKQQHLLLTCSERTCLQWHRQTQAWQTPCMREVHQGQFRFLRCL
jgi:hypothetical protein